MVKVGVIDFTPPQIMQWDKVNLKAKFGQPLHRLNLAAALVPM